MANITVDSPKETLNFNYDVNATADGSFTGIESAPSISMFIYQAANDVSYGNASSKTNTGITGSNNITGNLAVIVTNNSSTQTTNPIYFDVTITGANFTSNILTKTLLTTTSPTDGTLAPGANGTASIQVTHTGNGLTDTASIAVNLYEYYNGEYIAITTSGAGTVTVTISAAVLGIQTVVTGPTAVNGVYYLKSNDTFSYDITLTNSGNAAAKSINIKIVPDNAHLTIGTVIGSLNSDFSSPTTLTATNDVYTLPSDIAASSGVYYVRVPETAN